MIIIILITFLFSGKAYINLETIHNFETKQENYSTHIHICYTLSNLYLSLNLKKELDAIIISITNHLGSKKFSDSLNLKFSCNVEDSQANENTSKTFINILISKYPSKLDPSQQLNLVLGSYLCDDDYDEYVGQTTILLGKCYQKILPNLISEFNPKTDLKIYFLCLGILDEKCRKLENISSGIRSFFEPNSVTRRSLKINPDECNLAWVVTDEHFDDGIWKQFELELRECSSCNIMVDESLLERIKSSEILNRNDMNIYAYLSEDNLIDLPDFAVYALEELAILSNSSSLEYKAHFIKSFLRSSYTARLHDSIAYLHQYIISHQSNLALMNSNERLQSVPQAVKSNNINIPPFHSLSSVNPHFKLLKLYTSYQKNHIDIALKDLNEISKNVCKSLVESSSSKTPSFLVILPSTNNESTDQFTLNKCKEVEIELNKEMLAFHKSFSCKLQTDVQNLVDQGSKILSSNQLMYILSPKVEYINKILLLKQVLVTSPGNENDQRRLITLFSYDSYSLWKTLELFCSFHHSTELVIIQEIHEMEHIPKLKTTIYHRRIGVLTFYKSFDREFANKTLTIFLNITNLKIVSRFVIFIRMRLKNVNNIKFIFDASVYAMINQPKVYVHLVKPSWYLLPPGSYFITSTGFYHSFQAHLNSEYPEYLFEIDFAMRRLFNATKACKLYMGSSLTSKILMKKCLEDEISEFHTSKNSKILPSYQQILIHQYKTSEINIWRRYSGGDSLDLVNNEASEENIKAVILLFLPSLNQSLKASHLAMKEWVKMTSLYTKALNEHKLLSFNMQIREFYIQNETSCPYLPELYSSSGTYKLLISAVPQHCEREYSWARLQGVPLAFLSTGCYSGENINHKSLCDVSESQKLTTELISLVGIQKMTCIVHHDSHFVNSSRFHEWSNFTNLNWISSTKWSAQCSYRFKENSTCPPCSIIYLLADFKSAESFLLYFQRHSYISFFDDKIVVLDSLLEYLVPLLSHNASTFFKTLVQNSGRRIQSQLTQNLRKRYADQIIYSTKTERFNLWGNKRILNFLQIFAAAMQRCNQKNLKDIRADCLRTFMNILKTSDYLQILNANIDEFLKFNDNLPINGTFGTYLDRLRSSMTRNKISQPIFICFGVLIAVIAVFSIALLIFNNTNTLSYGGFDHQSKNLDLNYSLYNSNNVKRIESISSYKLLH